MTGIEHYDYAFDPDGGAWAARILRRIPSGATVLELGPGPGAMSRVLIERGHAVVAVEKDADAVSRLQALGVQAIMADLDSADWMAALQQQRFDVVLACDVLEHLVAPDRVLRALTGAARPDGCLIVSVPNIAYLGVLAAMHTGYFDYADKGLLDRTHLRFFTRRSFESTLLINGWIPVRWEANRVPIHESEFAWCWSALPEGLRAALLDGWSDADVYQWMVEATPAAEQGWQEAMVKELQQTREELNALRRDMHDRSVVHAREHAALLEHQKAFAEAKDIIERLTGQLQEAGRQTEALRQELAQRDRQIDELTELTKRRWRRWLSRWRRWWSAQS